ncbi:MAG: hypothetical protein APF83_13715 [Lutibacter sp. BRH_c52]|nr:MAG: hypothetical protein APF83_13715 [Lutibacter sp. BRH_c52]
MTKIKNLTAAGRSSSVTRIALRLRSFRFSFLRSKKFGTKKPTPTKKLGWHTKKASRPKKVFLEFINFMEINKKQNFISQKY